jgi:hypothetical protein
LIVESQGNDVLNIPPPILSRVFQTLSRGQVNLANCKKITFTLFPFPYAQLIKVLLITLNFMTPIIMSALVEDFHWAFIFTMIPLFGLEALNHIAKEIEIPFGSDANDLPLHAFQENMNNSMLMLIRQESDIVPHATEHAEFDFFGLRNKISTCRPKEIIIELEEKHMLSQMSGGNEKSWAKEQVLENVNINNRISFHEDKKAGVHGEASSILLEKTSEVVVPQKAIVEAAKNTLQRDIDVKLAEVSATPMDITRLPPMPEQIPGVLQNLVMQTKLEQLSGAFEGLMSHTRDLSRQLEALNVVCIGVNRNLSAVQGSSNALNHQQISMAGAELMAVAEVGKRSRNEVISREGFPS